MRILIVSDTHGHANNLKAVLERVWPIDALIHCGDVEGEEDYIAALAECPVFIVAGNNDYFSILDREIEFELQGKRIFLTHGHYYGVSMGTEMIKEEGESRKADIVVFGHTHKPCCEVAENITVLNPGSLAYPRQSGRKPSFMLLELSKDGHMECSTRYLG